MKLIRSECNTNHIFYGHVRQNLQIQPVVQNDQIITMDLKINIHKSCTYYIISYQNSECSNIIIISYITRDFIMRCYLIFAQYLRLLRKSST